MDAAGLRLAGVFAATVTPFRADESLDEDRLASHIEFLLKAGIHGIVVLGGSGEYVNLTPDERRRAVDVTVDVVRRRRPVIVGALGPSTREALDIGLHAARKGADALLVLPPYYIRPSLQGIVHHYAQVTKSTGLPVLAYNIQARTGWSMDLDALEAIAEVPGVVGLKECERDVAVIAAKIARLGERVAILSGDDDLGFATLLSGAPGAIWATPNLAPRLCLELFESCQSNDLIRARELHYRLMALVHVRRGPNHPGPLKEMMAMVGRSVGLGRRPLMPMTDAERSRVEALVRTFGPIA